MPGAIQKLVKRVFPSVSRKLFGSFYLDNANTMEALDFTPPFSCEEGISRTVEWYKQFRRWKVVI
jgi:nucleoside-diphosphate-sugar epimerase